MKNYKLQNIAIHITGCGTQDAGYIDIFYARVGPPVTRIPQIAGCGLQEVIYFVILLWEHATKTSVFLSSRILHPAIAGCRLRDS